MGGGGHSTPFRGGKATLWEGGIRVPCIVAWPGTLPAGQVRQQPVQSIDLLPTIAAWCQVPLLGLELDGRNLQPVIDSASSPPSHPYLAWTWQNWSTVRSGPWKLMRDGNNLDHLYNLDTDPGEALNLFLSQPATASRLATLRDDWMAQMWQDPRARPWLPR